MYDSSEYSESKECLDKRKWCRLRNVFDAVIHFLTAPGPPIEVKTFAGDRTKRGFLLTTANLL